MKKFAIAATLAAASIALAQGNTETKTYTGQGGPLPDLQAVRFEIFIPDHGVIVDIKQVCLDIDHTWVGDLIITLTQKDPTGAGVTTTLLDRPGSPPGFGNSDNLGGIYCFQAGAMPFPEAPGGAGLVAPGTYGLDPAGSYDAYRGRDKYGLWSLDISDNAGGDIGTLFAWSITMNNVPEPSSLALLALGALSFIRRR